MSEEPKGDGNNADGPLDDSGQGGVLAEKKRLARRRYLTGMAAAGAVLGTVTRAHAIGASVCFSGNPADQAKWAGVSQGNVLALEMDPDITLPGSVGEFTSQCGEPTNPQD